MMKKYFRGKIMAYHYENEPYNFEAVDIFLLDGGKLVQTFIERDQRRFLTLEECIEAAAFQDATIVTNCMRHLRNKMLAITILLEKRPRFVGLDSKYMATPIEARDHVKMLFEIATQDRRERSKGIQKGLQKAREQGKRLGAPKGVKRPDLSANQAARFDAFRKKILPIIKKIDSNHDLSLSQIANELQKRNVKTFQNKDLWSKSSVASIIKKGIQNDKKSK